MKIQDLEKYLNNYKYEFLAIGCPKGVGITTFMTIYMVEKFFFDDEFHGLIVLPSRYDYVNSINLIKEMFSEFDISYQFANHKFSFEGNSLAVIQYETNQKISNSKMWDVVFLDKAWDDPDLINFHFKNKSKLNVVSTYDTPNSIYYKVLDKYRIKIKSSFNEEEQLRVKNYPSEIINQDNIIFGEFNKNNQ